MRLASQPALLRGTVTCCLRCLLQAAGCGVPSALGRPHSRRAFLLWLARKVGFNSERRPSPTTSPTPTTTTLAAGMALQEVTASFLRRLRTQDTALAQASGLQCRRYASSNTASPHVAQEIQDLEDTDFVKQDPATAANLKYDPLHRQRSFAGTPPSSR